MVRAVLAGTKTQTRRIMKPQPAIPHHKIFHVGGRLFESSQPDAMGRRASANYSDEWRCPYGAPGDELWVRHQWWKFVTTNPDNEQAWDEFTRTIRWKTGECVSDCKPGDKERFWKKMPSLFMPRWASRITLEITGIRAERLQDISEADALAEGVTLRGTTRWETEAREAYSALWESINGENSWSSNPFVWVIEFKRKEQP